MLDRIKAIIQSEKEAILVATNSPDKTQNLYFCRYTEDFLQEGQPVFKGTYILCNQAVKETLMHPDIDVIEELDSNPIQTLVAPFRADSAVHTKLDHMTELVVTPRLTGCTFAIVEKKHAHYDLLHINKVDTEGFIDQEAINRALMNHGGKPIYCIEKSDYAKTKDGTYGATVMGFRQKSGHWEFHSQYTKCSAESKAFDSIDVGRRSPEIKPLLITQQPGLLSRSLSRRAQDSQPAKKEMLPSVLSK